MSAGVPAGGAATLLDDALILLGDLIGFPTVSGRSNLDLVDYAEQVLTAAGAAVTRTYDEHRVQANLFATIGPDLDGGVVLSGHTDVVPADAEHWTGAPFVAARRGGRVYGRGAADMKGFIACVLAMAPRFAAAPLERPVHIALTFDEEVGWRGAPLLLDELVRTGPRPAAAIVGEPTMLRVVAAHKGGHEFTTTVTGVEGHASDPGQGVNAVEVAVSYIAWLGQLATALAGQAPADSPFDPPGTTISVGVIEGGTARNVLAGACTFEWEIRPVSHADADRVRTAVAAHELQLREQLRRRHPDAGIQTTTIGAMDGLELRPSSPAVELATRLVGASELETASIGTEAGLYQRAGIPAVVCGPGSIEVAHRPDEFVTTDQLRACLGMLDRLAEELCGSWQASPTAAAP